MKKTGSIIFCLSDANDRLSGWHDAISGPTIIHVQRETTNVRSEHSATASYTPVNYNTAMTLDDVWVILYINYYWEHEPASCLGEKQQGGHVAITANIGSKWWPNDLSQSISN